MASHDIDEKTQSGDSRQAVRMIRIVKVFLHEEQISTYPVPCPRAIRLGVNEA